MSLLKDHKNNKSNARYYVLHLFHEIREVMASDLHPSEKEFLLRKAHREIAPRLWLIRPEDPSLNAQLDDLMDDLTESICPTDKLYDYVSSLAEILNYRSHLADFRLLAEELRAVIDDETLDNFMRLGALAQKVPMLERCVENTGHKPSCEMRMPLGHYFLARIDHIAYVVAIEKAVARG